MIIIKKNRINTYIACRFIEMLEVKILLVEDESIRSHGY
jgi:hypothetical protein